MTLIRINKYLADQGYSSRRGADEMVARGLVRVNGIVIKELGTKVDPEIDKITVNNKNQTETPVKENNRLVYIALNKPMGYITSTTSNQGQCIMDLIPKKFGRVFPIGRLDKQSEGLVVLTNDGWLTNQITHPRYEHEKEYEVVGSKLINAEDLRYLTNGFEVEDEFMKMASITPIRKNYPVYRIILKEGKKRQIRKMLKAIGIGVIRLKRTRINNLKLGDLGIGKWRLIQKKDII